MLEPILVDVRSEHEFQNMHLKGAINIPVQQIHLVENIPGSNKRPIHVYCQTGNRSEFAKNRLIAMGFNAVNIGGIIRHMDKI